MHRRSFYDYRYYYKRYLPHYQPEEAILFVTYRIKQKIPQSVYDEMNRKREAFEEKLINLPEPKRKHLSNAFNKKQFDYFDSILGNMGIEGSVLVKPEIAGIIKDSLHFNHGKQYSLLCYCIMPNHVHILIKPLIKDAQTPFSLTAIIKNHKSYTAKMANRILNRKGQFWQKGFYDHCIRDEREYRNVIRYILNNPVKAGLVGYWEEWPHSWLNPDARES